MSGLLMLVEFLRLLSTPPIVDVSSFRPYEARSRRNMSQMPAPSFIVPWPASIDKLSGCRFNDMDILGHKESS